MKRRQQGYFTRRTVLLLVLFGLFLAHFVPKFDDFSDRNKLTEAYHLASESKLRLSEFYKTSARFPSTETEVRSVTTTMFRQPDFVSAIVVENEAEEYDVIVKVYLKADVIDSDDGSDPFIYMAGTKPVAPGLALEWHCGASGVESHLLPRACSS